jgi:cellulose synthase/poly-beta-1,6-N-acetylglucosamine synthase-like glycosyltransferase
VSLLVAALVAAGMIYFFRQSRKNYLALPELPQLDFAEPVQDVIVIVPARNEERNIARVVSSFPRGWVLVVDDESTDRTAEIARANTAEVIPAPRLAGDLKGKPNACAAGARATMSDWVLFVDADTWYAPEFLHSALDYAEREKLDLLTVFPRQVTRTLAEKILLPYAFALYFCGVDAEAIQDPASPEALANGQCMLFRRSFYDFIGGHAVVAKSVIEDVDLAALAKRHRGRVRVMRAERMAFVRMYSSFAEIWRGFSKNSFRFLEANPRTGRKVIAASILAASWLPVIWWLARDESWIALAAFAAVPVFVLAPWYRGVLGAMASPLAIYLFQLIALNGMLVSLAGRKVLWKGRPV